MEDKGKELINAVLDLPIGARLDLVNKIVSSICRDGEVVNTEKRFEQVKQATEEVFCKKIDRSRKRENVLAKSCVAYIMRNEGFSTPKIGKVLNMDHSSILHLVKRVEDMLSLPWIYANDLEKIDQVINKLNENKIQEADGGCGNSVEGASV